MATSTPNELANESRFAVWVLELFICVNSLMYAIRTGCCGIAFVVAGEKNLLEHGKSFYQVNTGHKTKCKIVWYWNFTRNVLKVA